MSNAGTDDQPNGAFPASATPARACANSARKRRHIPNLSRSLASPSRGDKLSMIFQDAALALHDNKSPTSLASSNSGKSRLPLAQARHTRFGQSPYRHERGPYSYKSPSKLPTQRSPSQSSRFRSQNVHQAIEAGIEPVCSEDAREGSPDAHDIVITDGTDAKYQELPSIPYAETVSEDEMGTRDIMPISHAEAEEAQQIGITEWLKGVQGLNQTPTPAQRPATDDQISTYPSVSSGKTGASSSSSNKENDSPASASSPIRPPQRYLSVTTPSRFQSLRSRSAVHAPGSPNLPPGHLSRPPRRNQSIPVRSPNSNRDGPSPCDRTHSNHDSQSLSPFPIHEDADCKQPAENDPVSIPRDLTIQDETQMATALARLSPSVELQRKGRHGAGRKKVQQRCASYWDDDVLEPNSPAYRSKKGGLRERGEQGGCDTVEDKAEVNVGIADSEAIRVVRNGKEVRVLGESAESEVLTRERPFVAEAEGCEFQWGV